MSGNIKKFHFNAPSISLCPFVCDIVITICASFVMKICIPLKRNLNLTKISVSYIIPPFGSFYQGCPRTLRTALVYMPLFYC
jgi:hypothetical protein